MPRLRALASLCAPLALAGCLCGDLGQAATRATPAWRELEPGLRYARLERAGTVFHLVEANLATHSLGIADARRDGRKVERVDVLRAEANALVAVNGTFFDQDDRPLGLVIDARAELNPLRDVSWWAALVVRDGASRPVAELMTTDQIQALAPGDRASIAFAVQVGPRTVVGGRPLKLKAQSAARTALCVTHPGLVVLLATESDAVESNALAAFMAEDEAAGGLGCHSGLMLDGGPSTQLSVRAGGFAADVRGGWGVPNAVVVRARAAK